MSYPIFLPSFVLAGVVYHALASTEFIAVLAVLAVNLVGAGLVLVVDGRFARKAQRPESRERPVW